MSNKYDEKQREEVGYKDMEKYEDGGLEIEETLTNGYLLYIPYGIHCDLFEAMQEGIKSMGRYQDDLKKYHGGTDMEMLKNNFKMQIQELEKHIDVLQKIQGIHGKV